MLSPEDEITITIKKIVSRFRQCRIANADLIKLITHHVSCMFVFYICIQFAESITHKTFARTFSQVPVFRFDFQNLHILMRASLGKHGDHLWDGEETDQCGDDVDAARQRRVEYKALGSENIVKTNCGYPKPNAAGQQALDHRGAAQGANDRYPENGNPKAFAGPEDQSPFCQDRRGEN